MDIHIDFNKRNNNPGNITRMSRNSHLGIHRKKAKATLHRREVVEKCNRIKRSLEYRRLISGIIKNKYGEFLSKKAKRQWQDPVYKEYMIARYKDFYRTNKDYRDRILKIIYEDIFPEKSLNIIRHNLIGKIM